MDRNRRQESLLLKMGRGGTWFEIRLWIILSAGVACLGGGESANAPDPEDAPSGASAAGRVWIVDARHPQASDRNPGTAERPFFSIQKAASRARAGDTVRVLGGQYNERVIIRRSGAPQLPLRFGAEPPGAARMGGFELYGDYVQIEGFEITTQKTGNGGGGIWIAGHHPRIINNTFQRIPDSAIGCSNVKRAYWDEVYVAGNLIEQCNRGMLIRARGALIEDNEIRRLVRYRMDADYFRLFGENITLRRNYLHGTLETEIGDSHTDGWQTYGDNGDYLRHTLIENNVLTGFHRQGFFGTDDGVGNFDLTFRNNLIADSSSWGFSVKGFKDVKVYNNTFARIGHHGCALRNGSEGKIFNNIFYRAGSNYWADEESRLAAGHNLIFGASRMRRTAPTDLVNVDPLFVNPDDPLGTDGKPFTADDGYILSRESRAMDAGADMSADGSCTDLTGRPRPQGKGWDLGAYESY